MLFFQRKIRASEIPCAWLPPSRSTPWRWARWRTLSPTLPLTGIRWPDRSTNTTFTLRTEGNADAVLDDGSGFRWNLGVGQGNRTKRSTGTLTMRLRGMVGTRKTSWDEEGGTPPTPTHTSPGRSGPLGSSSSAEPEPGKHSWVNHAQRPVGIGRG